MIFDIKMLKDAMDFRDQELTKSYEERTRGLREEIASMEEQEPKDRAEIRRRAVELVNLMDSGTPLSATGLREWFLTKDRRSLGRPTANLGRDYRALEVTERHFKETGRVGEIQSFLQILLERGQALVQSDELRKAGFHYEFESWMDQARKAKTRREWKA